MSDAYDLAHDQELYAFEGETNVHLLPVENPARSYAFHGWSAGFEAGWRRAMEAK